MGAVLLKRVIVFRHEAKVFGNQCNKTKVIPVRWQNSALNVI